MQVDIQVEGLSAKRTFFTADEKYQFSSKMEKLLGFHDKIDSIASKIIQFGIKGDLKIPKLMLMVS